MDSGRLPRMMPPRDWYAQLNSDIHLSHTCYMHTMYSREKHEFSLLINSGTFYVCARVPSIGPPG